MILRDTRGDGTLQHKEREDEIFCLMKYIYKIL